MRLCRDMQKDQMHEVTPSTQSFPLRLVKMTCKSKPEMCVKTFSAQPTHYNVRVSEENLSAPAKSSLHPIIFMFAPRYFPEEAVYTTWSLLWLISTPWRDVLRRANTSWQGWRLSRFWLRGAEILFVSFSLETNGFSVGQKLTAHPS